MTQVAAAKALDISQPRVSDLIRGKVDKFTIEMLVNILTKLGYKAMMRIT